MLKINKINRKKSTILISGLVISLLFMVCSSFYKRPVAVSTIVIDAGHGGKDNGTAAGKEKRIALDIALKFGKLIEQNNPEIKVIYTRKTDVFIPLHERADIANRNKADLFVSIHCNAFPKSSSVRGTETYVMGLHKTEQNLALAKKENQSILFEDNYAKDYKGYNPNSPLAHIMMANYQSAFMQQSLDFAAKVEENMVGTGFHSRGVKQAGFLVIWETTMPSVLIETGYLTNPSDMKILNSEPGRVKVSNAIYKALVEYR